MKIGVVSDTHGCAATWREIFSRYLADAELIIHAGDILYHGPRNKIPAEYDPLSLAEELNNCPVPIVAACGNCDAEIDAMILSTPVQAPYAHLMVNGLRIVVNHGHQLAEPAKWELAEKMKARLFITGHTHVPSLDRRGGAIRLNPGSPGMSKREDKRGTIALLDNGRAQIIAVDNGEVLAGLEV